MADELVGAEAVVERERWLACVVDLCYYVVSRVDSDQSWCVEVEDGWRGGRSITTGRVLFRFALEMEWHAMYDYGKTRNVLPVAMPPPYPAR